MNRPGTSGLLPTVSPAPLPRAGCRTTTAQEVSGEIGNVIPGAREGRRARMTRMEHLRADPSERGWLRIGAVAIGGLAIAQVLAAVVLAPVAGFGWSRALTSFLATNGLMGAAFAASGLMIAWYRPRNPLGWLLVADGFGHATSALMAPIAQLLHDHGGPLPVLRVVLTLFMFAWPWSIALFLPMSLLLFPDGHLPSPRWRYAAWAIVLTAPLFVVEMVSGTEPTSEGMPLGYLTFDTGNGLDWLWTVSEARTSGALLLALVSLVVRYRRAGETERAQLLWLLMAGLVVVAAVAPWSFVAGTPIAVLFAIPLVPLAIAVAVIRHQLLDIRLVVSRALAWLLLSVAALVAYVAVVALLDTFVSHTLGRSAFATVLVAVALAPLLPRLQREVDRWMYGDRRDPARVAGRLGEALASGDERGLAGVVAALRSALRLPYVAIRVADAVLASDGTPPPRTSRLTLEYAGEAIGELEVGLRRGEQQLTATDLSTLRLVATPLAVALRALGLSSDLGLAQARLVVAREEERRRLRRDLHDGLGPTLTGMAMAADAAANFLDADPGRTRELLQSLRRDARSALADVRQLVDNLTPPVLGELGLLGALEQRVEQFRSRGDGRPLDVRLVVPDALPVLPVEVEVAAYRIATEALVNVARHAVATSAVVEVRCDDTLDVVVTDDGANHASWSPGVGLEAMRERASEVGGFFEAGPSRGGGRVFVSIPVVAS
jgi:two-component system NarL family sensor kinase